MCPWTNFSREESVMDSQPYVHPATPADQAILPHRPFTAPSVEEIGHLQDLTLQVTGGGELDVAGGALEVL
jgi:hypothetical protein